MPGLSSEDPPQPELTALLAEDHTDIRFLLELELDRGGFVVVAAKDGQEALDLLDSAKPDVLVTDLQMPRLDGHQLVLAIRAIPEYKRLPVVLMTAAPHGQRAREIAALPLVEVISKPPSWSKIASRLIRLIAEAQEHEAPPLPVELLDILEEEAVQSGEPGVAPLARAARTEIERAAEDDSGAG